MNVLELFAGAGGGILGHQLLGHRTVCAVEYDQYAASVLMQRQNDGILPPFPIWDDVRTFDGKQWRGIIDCVSGGFPCQDISKAGRGQGITGKKSSLWGEMARVICDVRPRYVFVENTPELVSRGLAVVLGDLAKMGYDAEWLCLSASNCGAPHKRDRIWLLANNNMFGRIHFKVKEYTAERRISSFSNSSAGDLNKRVENKWWGSEPELDRMVNGMAHWMDRTKAIGNGQVPIVAATAFQELMRRITE